MCRKTVSLELTCATLQGELLGDRRVLDALREAGADNAYLRLRVGALSDPSEGDEAPRGARPAGVWPSNAPLSSMLEKGQSLSDGFPLFAQPLEEPETFTPNHLLLRVAQWHPAGGRLGPAEELALPRDTTLAQLKARLAAEPEHLRLAKPWLWMTRDPALIAGLAWKEPPEDETVGGARWRLKDGDLLIFKDARVPEAAAPPAREDPRGAGEAPGAEVGFRIFSADESLQRLDRARREETERQQRIRVQMDQVRAALRREGKVLPGAGGEQAG